MHFRIFSSHPRHPRNPRTKTLPRTKQPRLASTDHRYRPSEIAHVAFTPANLLLSDALKALGMPLAFDSAQADFSGATGQRDLFISNVIHKAYVAVDEKGTEAAAATAVIMTGAGAPANPQPPVVVRADHPFIFFIRDQQTGSILFVGRVVDPS
jgi:serine protease inhibitor